MEERNREIRLLARKKKKTENLKEKLGKIYEEKEKELWGLSETIAANLQRLMTLKNVIKTYKKNYNYM